MDITLSERQDVLRQHCKNTLPLYSAAQIRSISGLFRYRSDGALHLISSNATDCSLKALCTLLSVPCVHDNLPPNSILSEICNIEIMWKDGDVTVSELNSFINVLLLISRKSKGRDVSLLERLYLVGNCNVEKCKNGLNDVDCSSLILFIRSCDSLVDVAFGFINCSFTHPDISRNKNKEIIVKNERIYENKDILQILKKVAFRGLCWHPFRELMNKDDCFCYDDVALNVFLNAIPSTFKEICLFLANNSNPVTSFCLADYEKQFLEKHHKITFSSTSCPPATVAAALSSVIAASPALKVLDFSHSSFNGNDAILALSSFLQSPLCHVSDLSISACGIDDKAAVYIIENARNCSTLRSLDLSDNLCTDVAVRFMISLVESEMRDCRIEKSNVKQFVEFTRDNNEIRDELEIEAENSDDIQGGMTKKEEKRTETNTYYEKERRDQFFYVEWSGNAISKTLLKELSIRLLYYDLPLTVKNTLESINDKNNKKKQETKQEENKYNNEIFKRGIYLDFSNPKECVTDEILHFMLPYFKEHQEIEIIDFSDQSLTDSAAEHIACLMRECTALRVLRLCKNYLTPSGIRVLERGLCFAVNLEILDLKDQKCTAISKDSTISLPLLYRRIDCTLRARKSSHHVKLLLNRILEEDKNFTKIDLSFSDSCASRECCGKCTEEDVKLILGAINTSRTSAVKELDISGNIGIISPLILVDIADFAPRLSYLGLAGLGLCDNEVIKYVLGSMLGLDSTLLANSRSKRTIADRPSPAALAARACQLKQLDLRDNCLTSAVSDGICALLQAWRTTSLRHVYLEGNQDISIDERDSVAYYCDFNHQPDYFRRLLVQIERPESAMPPIKAIILSKISPESEERFFFDIFGANCYKLSEVCHLTFFNGFDDLHVRLLTRALRCNYFVETVLMPNNNCGNDGARYWSELFKVGTGIRFLDISYNFITDTGLEEMLISIRNNSMIKMVCFDGNPIVNESLLTELRCVLAERSSYGSAVSGTQSSAHPLQMGEGYCISDCGNGDFGIGEKKKEDSLLADAMSSLKSSIKKTAKGGCRGANGAAPPPLIVQEGLRESVSIPWDWGKKDLSEKSKK